jgi:uncharacterized protein
MNKSKILKQIEIFAKEQLAHDATGGHDWWHIQRVLNNAALICKNEKADSFIVSLAILLHDVGDYKVIGKSEDDYSIAENALTSQVIDQRTIEQVMYIIKNMSFSSSINNENIKRSVELNIVQDADRLDAIGAIGIARTFSYGGSKGNPIYDPSRKIQTIISKKSYRSHNSDPIHHMYEKLFLLKDLMNTKTAKKLALKRHHYMQKYVHQFLEEWKGRV